MSLKYRRISLLVSALSACSSSSSVGPNGTGGAGGGPAGDGRGAAGGSIGTGGTRATTAGTGGMGGMVSIAISPGRGTGGAAPIGTGGAPAPGTGGAVVGGTGGAGGVGPAIIPTICYPGGWCWEQPTPTGASMPGVHGVGGDAWIVGSDGVVLHLPSGGKTWLPTFTGFPFLGLVFAAAPDAVWIGGYQGALALWDGTGWSSYPSGTTHSIVRIWGVARDDLWGVGEAGTALHFDGARWIPTMTPVAAADEITTVYGTASNDVWAAGGATLIHWNGSAWTTVHPGDGAAGVAYNSIWMASATDGWIAGSPDSHLGTALYRWDGTAWNRASAPFAGNVAISRIWGLAADDVWAIGENGAAIHWDGSTWTPTTTGVVPYLDDIWGARSDDIWAVGGHGIAAHWDGEAWSLLYRQAATDRDFKNAAFLSASDGWAVADGAILRWDGTSWTASQTATMTSFYDVWANASDDVWVSGSAGVVLRWNGSAWRATPLAGSSNLFGISGAGGGNVWAVGDAQTASDPSTYRWTGTDWLPEPIPAGVGTLRDVLAVDQTTALAVGDGGAVLKWSGSAWEALASGTTAQLDTIWCAAPCDGDVWIGGANGTLLRLAGSTLTPMTAPTTMGVKAIWGSAATDVWLAAQSNEQVFHYNGTSWSHSETGSEAIVSALAGDSRGDVWAFGYLGTILHRRPVIAQQRGGQSP